MVLEHLFGLLAGGGDDGFVQVYNSTQYTVHSTQNVFCFLIGEGFVSWFVFVEVFVGEESEFVDGVARCVEVI